MLQQRQFSQQSEVFVKYDRNSPTAIYSRILYLKRDCKFQSHCYLLIGLVSLHNAMIECVVGVSSKTYSQGYDVHFHTLMLGLVGNMLDKLSFEI